MEDMYSVKSKIKEVKLLKISVNIPAYDQNRNGNIFNLVMEALQNDSFTNGINGSVEISLKNRLEQVIQILSNLGCSWKIHGKSEYNLSTMENQHRIISASNFNGIKQIQPVTGTGILRTDGTFEKSHLKDEQKQTPSQIMESMFINILSFKHRFNLATLGMGLFRTPSNFIYIE